MLMYYFPSGSRNLDDVYTHQTSIDHVRSPMGIDTRDLAISKFLPDDRIDLKFVNKTQPVLFCHDQEPLNFDLYLDDGDIIKQYKQNCLLKKKLNTSNVYFNDSNLRWAQYNNIQKSWTLLHSELNSPQVTRYEATEKFVGAYWWSHAVLARDWYRFAEHDTTLIPDQTPKKLFLMYCRDTSGSREYRKDLLGHIDRLSLQSDCQTESFDQIKVGSDASAVYNVTDHNLTGISVVLETIFDERIHLTEKILRPIACGHPFILAAGPSSLQLLKSYGFCTFAGHIDESYDGIQDNNQRLVAIAHEMKRIQQLPPAKLKSLLEACQSIAQYNRNRFFSKEFFDQVIDELVRNISIAWAQHQGEIDFELWWNTAQWYRKNGLRHLDYRPYRQVFSPLYRKCRLNRVE
jgi:hypothetical protein